MKVKTSVRAEPDGVIVAMIDTEEQISTSVGKQTINSKEFRGENAVVDADAWLKEEVTKVNNPFYIND